MFFFYSLHTFVLISKIFNDSNLNLNFKLVTKKKKKNKHAMAKKFFLLDGFPPYRGEEVYDTVLPITI